ncbi:hypothetical protein MDOR_36450 [Mycolicibacterium doricum]|uniref:Oxidoreductase n=1 Tax=Mycolicibacterium doricum TaxID=126673 RepID=A0A1X1TP99_9MYCO|nr:hypothetical protein [Mycolicibacterium doricum]MCV7269795.1 hypothetical protein [Mycolicibacterium doricum]ORV46387.1 oxidoreductase [Mycolicibacterium doricum]BBZ09476.1 hypothetical protein MDOR_36450 [Mycolicibacterium doricum]
MSNEFADETIDVVAPGDAITMDRGSGPQSYKVVHKNDGHDSYLVTMEGADGETFEHEFPSGATVTRSLESKWESTQSPTPKADAG